MPCKRAPLVLIWLPRLKSKPRGTPRSSGKGLVYRDEARSPRQLVPVMTALETADRLRSAACLLFAKSEPRRLAIHQHRDAPPARRRCTALRGGCCRDKASPEGGCTCCWGQCSPNGRPPHPGNPNAQKLSNPRHQRTRRLAVQCSCYNAKTGASYLMPSLPNSAASNRNASSCIPR